MKQTVFLKNVLLLVLIHIIGSNVALAGDTYVKVTSADQLMVGKKYLIVYSSGSKALGPQSGSVRTGISVSTKNDGIVLDGTSTVTPVTLGGNSSNGYTLKLGDGNYLCSTNNSGTDLTSKENLSTSTRWFISIDNSTYNYASIKNKYTDRLVRYDPNSTSFKAYSSTSGTNGVTLFVQSNTITVSAAAEGMGTYVTNDALDFSAFTDFFAYTATADGNTVTFNRVSQVPAGTPILVRSTADFGSEPTRTVTVPVISSASAVGSNALVAGTGVAVEAQVKIENVSYLNYVLSKGSTSNAVGFYLANGTSVVASNKAYLRIQGSLGNNVKAFIGFNEDETTDIKTLENEQLIMDDSAIYDLQGRKVSTPTRGVYIINGKKVVVK